MTAMVLVHGAWGGSYGFRSVRPLIWQAGHSCFTPSLTGIGERAHLTSPQVSLTTHVQDVVNTILYEDLHDIVLLGFSYGGMVVTGALEHVADRIAHLVYLDAFVPSDGDSVFDRLGGTPSPLETGADWLVPPLPRELGDPTAQAFSDARRSPQPIGTFAERVRVTQPLETYDFSLTYIKATADDGEPDDSFFWQAARRAQASADWNYHEIATHHLVPFTHPEEVAAILVDLVKP